MKKRILAMLLCIAMVLSVMPVAAFATEAEETPQVLAAEEPVEIVEETTEAAVEETEAAEETVAEAAEETVAEEPAEAEPEATEAAEEAVEEIVPQEPEAVTEEIIEVPGGEDAVGQLHQPCQHPGDSLREERQHPPPPAPVRNRRQGHPAADREEGTDSLVQCVGEGYRLRPCGTTDRGCTWP